MKKTKRSLLISMMFLIAAVCMIFAACGDGKNVKIAFHTNGGEAIETVSVAKGDGYSLPDAQWEGHSFEGWYLDEGLTDGPYETVVAEKDLDFYAKWEQTYKLTVVLDGGTLSGFTGSEVTLWLKAGTKLAAYLQDYVPQKAGHRFAAWYNGENELSANASMGQEELTLTARYKVQYTVSLYLQNLDQTGYEKAEEDYIGYEFAGTKNFLPAVERKGFTQVDHEQASNAKDLSEDPAQNAYALYFNRNEVNVVFISNAPNETASELIKQKALFGAEIELPGDLFAAEGYVLSGWSKTPSGADPISTNYVQTHAFNADGSAEPGKVIADNDSNFFGVWTKGYTDLFGGSDYIYHFDAEATDIYLCRAGQYFVGTYTARTRTFRFLNSANRAVVEGKLNTDGTFVYRDDDLSGFSRILYVYGQGIDENTTIHFDAYDGITYSVKTDVGTTLDSKGTYYIDENGYHVATFTTGDLAGQTITFITGQSNDGYEVFAIRNDTEYNWGEMHRAAVSSGSLTYYTSAYRMQLNGFGTAALVSSSGNVTTYSYTRDGDEITLKNTDNQVYMIARHFTMNGTELYTVYNADYDHTYTAADGSTLALDGTHNALYSAAGAESYYSLYSSAFGHLAETVIQGETYLFLLKTESRTDYDDDGKAVTVYDYTFERRPASYKEYYYCGDSFSSAMLVVMDEEAQGKVTLYGRNDNREYEKVLLGSYTFDEKTGVYSVVVDNRYSYSDSVSALYDYSRLAEFTFSTDIYEASTIFGTFYYPVTYWHSVTMEETEKEEFGDVYLATEGDGKLTVYGAFAILEWEGGVFSGQYSVSDTLMTITPYGSSNSLYIELDEAERTYILLTGMLGTAYRLNPENGSRVTTETLTFDGKGGAVYSFKTTEGGSAVTHTYEGTFVTAEETSVGGSVIYVFTSNEGGYTFRFILLSSSSYTFFAREVEEGSKTITSEDSGKLLLDGFGFYAKYTAVSGASLEGQYTLPDENTVYFIYGSQYGFYFDLDGDTFSIRGSEYGDYIYIDNNGSRGIYFLFDGYGHLTVYSYNEDEAGEGSYTKNILDADGTYEITKEKVILNFQIGADHYVVNGLFGTIKKSGYTYLAFIGEHEEVVSVYINSDDWSVLVLDAYGTATKHKVNGTLETGMYLLITDDLLYYVNSDGTDACLFRYNKAAASVTEIRYKSARGYFTQELDALLFSEAGFMIEGGETRYYYEIDDEGYVTLYHQDWEADAGVRNEYGFVVSKDFGKFEDTKIIDGKTYYVNTGYAIVFKRDEATAEKYPITVGYQYAVDDDGNRVKDEDGNYVTQAIKASLDQLSFTPSGAAEFAVTGTVVIDGVGRTCTVYRRLNEDGTYRMYLTIPTNGAGVFVYDIGVSYTGDSASATSNNVYEITGMRVQTDLYSSTYLQYYYYFYLMTGKALGNSFGFISIVNTYDELGDVDELYIDGAFGGSSYMYDTLGELVKLDHASYVYNGSYYTVEIEREDGYTYYLTFSVSSDYYSIFGVYSYDLVAFTRVEAFDVDGYRIEAERIVSSDYYTRGQYKSLKLFKDGEELTADTIYLYNDTLFFIIRTQNENGTNTAAEYFVISFKVAESDVPSIGEGSEGGNLDGEGEDVNADGNDVKDGEGEGEEEETENRNPLPVFESASVRYFSTATYYSADGANFVDISEETHDVLMITIGKTVHLIEKTEYNEETGVYTVTTLNGKVFTVTKTESVVEITEVVTESEAQD